MLRKLGMVILPVALLSTALAALACYQEPAKAAPLAAAWMTILVLVTMFAPAPLETAMTDHLPEASGTTASPYPEPWKSFYERTTQMHIDTDKGMYQLITVFVGASVLVFGWVAGSSRAQPVTGDDVALVGSLAVVLVGVATLLKHRLRYYNKLREIYLRRLESRLCPDLPGRSGPHTFLAAVSIRGLVSFHEAVDIYYFIHAFLWCVLYVWKA